MATESAFAGQFPEALFRQSIRDAMLMGMPELVEDRLTWFWRRAQTFTPDDLAGDPLDWSSAPVTDDPGNPAGDPDDDGVVVDYALESLANPEAVTVIGDLNLQNVKVTVFDVDYEQIRTADYAQLRDIVYQIRFEAPATPLFGVTMHDIYLEAQEQAE